MAKLSDTHADAPLSIADTDGESKYLSPFQQKVLQLLDKIETNTRKV